VQPDDLAAARVGRTIGEKWKLERLLGEGGMAAVYAASDPSGQRAAIKVLHPEMTRRKDVRERFLREAYVANRISHPGAVRVLSHGHDSETYLVMELLEGEPLSARAQRLSDFTVRELLGYANEILDVLAAAHDKGVIHRDIKPDNIFVTNDRHAKILDFGIARVLDDVPQAFKTRTGLALGTVPYMAPEQALGRRGEVDGRSDLFALGALLFRILSGRRIHDEKSEAELLVAMATRPAPSLASVAPNVPAPVSAVVDIALAFSRDARYPDARTMQKDVQALLSSHRPPYATAHTSKREASTRMDNPMMAAVPFGADAATAETMVASGQIANSDSMSAPTRVEVQPQPAATPNVTAPLRAVEVPHSQRPGAQAIAMPMIDDLDALIMTLPPVPSGHAPTLPAGMAPPPAAPQPAQPIHDSAPPPSNMPVAAGAFPPSVPAETQKSSGALPLVMIALFGFGALAVVGVVGVIYFFVLQEEAPAEGAASSAAPSVSASAAPVDSTPIEEPSASTDAATETAPRATGVKPKPATTTKAITPASARSATAAPPPPPPPPPATTTAPKTPPPPPPPPREEKGKGKGKDKDK
jgi:serine/threonine-protein kinase